MSFTASAMWRMRAAMALPSLLNRVSGAQCASTARRFPWQEPLLRTSIDAEPLEIDLRPAARDDIRHHPPAAAGLRQAVRPLADIDEQVGDAGATEIGRAIGGHGAQACPRAHRAIPRHFRE